MSEHDDLIDRLADLVGIARGYTDYFGNPVASPIEARRAILADFGLPTATEALARESLERAEELRHGLLPRLIPVEAGRTATIPLRGSGDSAVWRLVDEGGALREGRASVSANAQALALPRLAPGYYRLTVEASGRSGEATVIAAPPRSYEMRELSEGARYWGLAAQLYSLRSQHNLGIGTYRDTADAAVAVGALGAVPVGAFERGVGMPRGSAQTPAAA
jgi:(1->4)-alpha-D-glucan 1-alpha-D-glucosylmutase